MAELTAIYVDFQCPFSYRAWRWLSRLPMRERVEVRPYLLDGADGGPWDRETPTIGLELLALGELARDTGADVHLRFIDAAFVAVHESAVDVASPEAWLRLGASAGLDLDTFTADTERWRAEVGLWHQEAEDELGVFATPTLVFGDECLFVRLSAHVGDAPQRLLDDLTDLVAQPVAEVRRTE